MKKRGAIELQFNWIFVLFAGAIILMFFITIINKQRALAELKTNAVLANNLESIITGAQISTNTVNVIELPSAEVSFECGSYAIGQVKKDTHGNVVFAPSAVKGSRMIAWARDWSVPYRITNLLYVTGPGIRYIIVNNSNNLGRKVFDILPREMNKEVVRKDQLVGLEDKNNGHIRFIFFGPPGSDDLGNALSSFQHLKDEQVSGVIFPDLATAAKLPSTGTVNFYKKSGTAFLPSAPSFFLKEESFFGALFSGDDEMYNCEMKKAFQKLSVMSRVYMNRSRELAKFYTSSHPCFQLHRPQRLEAMENYAAAQSTVFPSDLQSINNIQANALQIGSEQNQQLQILSCAMIY